MFSDYQIAWHFALNSDRRERSAGMNKLRPNKRFKYMYIDNVEAYVRKVLPKCHRSMLPEFCHGVALISVETGRYERLPPGRMFVSFV